MLIEFILSNFKTLGAAAIALIMVFLARRIKSLSMENRQLNLSSKEKEKVINIQAKVLDASENIKSTDLDGNLERLSDKNG